MEDEVIDPTAEPCIPSTEATKLLSVELRRLPGSTATGHRAARQVRQAADDSGGRKKVGWLEAERVLPRKPESK